MGRAAGITEWTSVIARAKRLDPGAFDEIVDAYTGRLFGFFHRMLGRRDEAEDLVQEVFVRVVRTIKDYRDDGHFESWLFKIAGNLARDRMRRARGAPNVEENGSESGLEGLAGSRHDDRVQSATAGDEERDQLQRFLERLPSMEREVVLMRHFGELSFQEIAEYTGSPLGTVLSRAHRGLSRLREWMESQR